MPQSATGHIRLHPTPNLTVYLPVKHFNIHICYLVIPVDIFEEISAPKFCMNLSSPFPDICTYPDNRGHPTGVVHKLVGCA